MTARRRRSFALAAGAFVVLTVTALFFHAWLLRGLGAWLVVSEPLRPADAIVVLAGGTPQREIAAADLFRQGLAPRVVLSLALIPRHHAALVGLGIRPHEPQAEARLVLEGHGVPASAILALKVPVKITEAELALVRETVEAAGLRRVILVSSADHGRRIKMIWADVGGSVEALVYSVRDETFLPDRWWRDRRMIELLLHEYLGITAYRLGISHLVK
jgi:uncharacterized SAM-binding protein YcdF (DUF218 family)